jgi:hypothetical protein
MYVNTEYGGIFKMDKQTGQIWMIPLVQILDEPRFCIFELGTVPCAKEEIIKRSSP